MIQYRCLGMTWRTRLPDLVVMACAMVLSLGVRAEPIRIGQSLPETQDSFRMSTSIRNTTEALVAAFNARGGVRGSRVELITLMDDGSPEGYARNVAQLLDQERVVAVVNCLGDLRCMEAKRMVIERDGVLVGTISGAAELRDAPEHVFPVRASYAIESEKLAQQLATIGIGSIALFSDGTSLPDKRRVLVEALRARAIAVQVIEVSARGDDMVHAVDALQGNLPSAVLLDLSAPALNELGSIFRPAPTRLPPVFASLSDPVLALGIAVFQGRTFGFTTVVPNPESLVSLVAGQFRRDVADDSYGMTYLGLEAYLNLRVVLETLAHLDKPSERKALRDALVRERTMKIGELVVAPSGTLPDGGGRVGLGVLSARGIVLE